MNDLDELARKREQQQNQDAVNTTAYERLKAQGALDDQARSDYQKRRDQERADDERRLDQERANEQLRADDLRQDDDQRREDQQRDDDRKREASQDLDFGESTARAEAPAKAPARGQSEAQQATAKVLSNYKEREKNGEKMEDRTVEVETPTGAGDFTDIYGNPISRQQLEGALSNYQAQAARGNLPSSVQALANGQGLGVKAEEPVAQGSQGWVPEIGNDTNDTTDTTGAPGDNESTNVADAVSDTAGIDKQGLSVASQAVDNLLDIGVDAAPQEDSQADLDVGKSDEEKDKSKAEARETEVQQDDQELDFSPDMEADQDTLDYADLEQDDADIQLEADPVEEPGAAPELSEAQQATQTVLNEYAERAAQGEVMEDRTVQVNLGQESITLDDAEIADDLDQTDELQDDQPVIEDETLEQDVALSPAQEATQEVLNDYQARAEKGEVMADRTVAVSIGHHESGMEQFELPVSAGSSADFDYETALENAKPDHIKERELSERNGSSTETGTDYEDELEKLRKRMEERKEREKSQGNERG